jgi:hypothetical protein
VFEESFLGQVKRLLVGRPIPSDRAHHERLSKATGLAVLSSDALSSVAYATEEVLRVLMVGGLAAMTWSPTIALMIAGLLGVVALSYTHTIRAYPGGGRRRVHRLEGEPRETAGCPRRPALLIDYTLTCRVRGAGVPR